MSRPEPGEAAMEDDADSAHPPLLPSVGNVVVVQLGDARFGLPIEQVREVLRTPPITAVPFVPPHVSGLVSVRGTLVPVVDLGVRLLARPAARPGRLVVIGVEEVKGSIGALVDSVVGLVDVLPGAVRPPPAEAEAALPTQWVAGVLAPKAERLVTLLHLQPVLAPSHPADKEQA